jgi:L-threonylcarbamoyladenylate synthase
MDNERESGSTDQRSTIIPRSAPRAIEWAAEEIARGGVVAIPTDTVYGLVASLAHAEAIERIYALKGRPEEQPLPVLVASVDALEHVTSFVDGRVQMLLNEFWPGPVTVVIPSDRNLPAAVLGPGNTVGVRIPNHPLAIEVIGKAGGAVASTSANRSGEAPALTAADVEATFGAELDLILDGGIAPGGRASTVVAIRGDTLKILREGPIDESELQSAWDNYPTLV